MLRSQPPQLLINGANRHPTAGAGEPKRMWRPVAWVRFAVPVVASCGHCVLATLAATRKPMLAL